MGRDESLGAAGTIAAAVEIPVSADLENGFADDPAGVADTVRMAIDAGLAGCSIEDFSGGPKASLYDMGLAVERVAAATEAAHAGGHRIVITARAENYIRGRVDLADTIARLQAYEAAGADVLYAPGVQEPDELRALVGSVGRPVNVLARPGAPTVAELGALGVARISVGGAFLYTALGAVVEAARELRDEGTYGYLSIAGPGMKAARQAFGSRRDGSR